MLRLKRRVIILIVKQNVQGPLQNAAVCGIWKKGPLSTLSWISALGPSLLHDPMETLCSTWCRQGSGDDLELSWLSSNSLGATSFSSRFPDPRRFLARHRTAIVSSTLANVTRPSTVLPSRGWISVMIFETLLAKIVHEVSLLHLQRNKQDTNIQSIIVSYGVAQWPCLHLSASQLRFLILCAYQH
jgi:hypothetical protein